MNTQDPIPNQLEAELRNEIASGSAAAERFIQLGAELHRSGRLEAALKAFEIATERAPALLNNWLAVATLRLQLNLPQAALEACNLALQRSPNDLQCLYSAGVVLTALTDNAAALHCYDKVLASSPQHYGALRNRPLLLIALGREEDAKCAAQTAISTYPNDPWLYYNYGELLLGLRAASSAAAMFRDALSLAPDFHQARYALAIALAAQGQVTEACTERSLALTSEPTLASSYRSPLVLDAQYGTNDVSPERIAIIAGFERLRMADWTGYAAFQQLYAELVQGRHGNPPLAQHEMPYLALGLPVTEDLRQQVARQAAQRVSQSVQGLSLYRPRRQRAKLIRIAYLSANFRPHPNAYLMGNIYQRHDRARFRIYAYALGPHEPCIERTRVTQSADVFRDLERFPLEAAAQLIVNDEIDILVDLSGFTRYAKPEILALRPALIQVSYTGFMGTLGASYIDYAILDRHILQHSVRKYWDEKIAYLPFCSYHCELPAVSRSNLPVRRDYGLPENKLVLCGLHSPRKLEPATYTLWMELLNKIPDAVLWLLYEDEAQVANLSRLAKELGVSEARLIFAPVIPNEEHLIRYALADIVLDTLLYNGHTTTVDALGMGVPVITLSGESVVARIAGSMLKAHGVPELVASTVDEYKAIVIRLATDANWREEMRRRVSDYAHSQLFCPERRVREIETAYEMMWARHQAGLPPEDFDVPVQPL